MRPRSMVPSGYTLMPDAGVAIVDAGKDASILAHLHEPRGRVGQLLDD